MQPLPDEKALIERAKKKDKEAIGILYEAYVQSIFQYISYRVETAELAQDLTAEVFLRMIRGLAKYKYTGAPFGAWLFRVASNQIADHYRREAKSSDTILIEEQIEGTAPDLFNTISKEEEKEQLRLALKKLPEDYQNVLIMRFMQNLPHATIAEIMDKSNVQIRVTQHRALKALGVAFTQLSGKGGNNDV